MPASEFLYIRLSDFSSFIEVSIGLNLGFAFLRQLRDAASDSINEEITKFQQEHTIREPDDIVAERDADHVDRLVNAVSLKKRSYEATAQPWYRLARWMGVLGATPLILCLLWVGFYPQTQVSRTCAYSALFLLSLPIPAITAGLAIYFVRIRRKVKKLIDLADAEMIGIRTGHDDLFSTD